MRIVVVTWARNCAATLSRAVDSVLAQSFGAFDYYLIDNASEDNTLAIMNDYSAKDERVKVIANKQNDMRVLFTLLPDLYERYSDDDALIILDADDEYTPDCFQSLTDFLGAKDFVCCGTDIINSETGQLIEQRICAAANNPFFTQIYNYLRTFWGKLIPFRTLKRCEFDIPEKMIYGIDTLFALEVYKRSETYGVLPGTHHRYYLSQGSVSYRFDPLRFTWDCIAANKAYDALISKHELTTMNNNFIREVRYSAAWDTIRATRLSGNGRKLPGMFLKSAMFLIFPLDAFMHIFYKIWRKHYESN
ncbi:MAG: glycosyltransferase [Oscillospiraceae bacterium]|jgi:glycosyltransferase involved in cell wall biosynthesis|nr:glycosyltransferase [Oscillospiraceae bacterium]